MGLTEILPCKQPVDLRTQDNVLDRCKLRVICKKNKRKSKLNDWKEKGTNMSRRGILEGFCI